MISIPDSPKSPGTQIGKPVRRVDGPAKVTGRAKYAGEFNAENLAYGIVVNSAIARGTITRIDAADALCLPGVLHVFTHENRPKYAWFDRRWKDDDAPGGSPFRPLHDNKIVYSGQPIALVVAETFELARYAASLVRVEYEQTPHNTDLRANTEKARTPSHDKGGYEPPPKPKGDIDKAMADAAATVEVEYHCPTEHHNPMEMHASTVIYSDDGTLEIYDKTQGVQNSQKYVTNVFGLTSEQVRVKSPYVGGAFGSGLRPQYQLFMAVMAATQLKRSVRVTLTRQQMFTFGHRPETIHKLRLGASSDGKLTALSHAAVHETSQFEDYVEIVVNWSGQLYPCENTAFDHKVASLDVYSPLDMRAPGAAWGVFAIETAMDELSYKLNIDPLELRLINYAERDPNKDKPFTSKELKACYSQAAERFGWSKRVPATRATREGNMLIGWGMATGTWDALTNPAAAKAVLSVDGKLIVASATADIGTGTYTIMTQIAADTLGLPIDAVTFKLGDSSLPMSPISGGSWTAASIGTAVKAVCDQVGDQILKLAQKMPKSPLAKAKWDDVTFSDGRLHLRSDSSVGVSITDAMRAAGVLSIEKQTTAVPNLAKQLPYTKSTHSAVFVEVKVDEDLGRVEVSRVVSAVAAGRILNPKTAASQVSGAVVWGIGMALEEETFADHNLGRFMNHDLAEYHVPVNKDVNDIDVIFVKEDDDIVNPLGVKGVGEIGIVGVAAAIGNAIYHATGKRVRSLPFTIDKLL